MKYLFLILFFVLQYLCITSQSESIKKRELNFELYSSSNFTVGSTHLPLNFFRKSYFGGFINEKDKGNTKSVNKIQRNGLELDINIGIKIFNPDNLNGWYFSFQNLITAGISYRQGLFDLIFRGNNNIKNDVLLSKTSFHFRNHQLLHFGKFYKKFSFGLALGNILQEFNGKFGDNDLIGLSDPYNWDIALSPKIELTENTSNIIKKNGNSLGLDIKYNDISKSKKFKYSIEIRNLGLILLHKNIKKMNYDTSFIYSGLALDELSDISNFSDDVTINFEPKIINKNQWLVTPFTIKADVLHQLKKIGVLGGVFYRNNSQYLPMSYLGINYKNHTKIIYGTKLYYGGYNHLQWGINAIYNSKKIKGEIDFQNCFSLIPSLGTSFGLLLKLSWKII